MEITQYSVWWVDLNPTQGSEQRGQRPCLVVSPNELHKALTIAIVVPLTTKQKTYPTVAEIRSIAAKTGSVSYALIEQIRVVSKLRIKNYICDIDTQEIAKVRQVIEEMLLG